MLLFLSLSLALCGVSATPIATLGDNQRIVGGFDAYAGQFPYQVSIRLAVIGMHLCGGSIISNEWILTSALCVMYDARLLRVVAGSIYLNSGGVTHKVLFGVKHPDHDEEEFFLNDIGLMRLNGQIIYSDVVKPVKLSNQPSSDGLPLTVAGWGYKHINNWVKPNTLQYITVKTIPVRDCEEWFNDLHFYDTQICTYSSVGQAICLYDNGGPLVYNGEQHGIASFPGLCGNGYPDIHTKVASFRSWIKEISNV